MALAGELNQLNSPQCEVTYVDFAAHSVRFQLIGEGGRVAKERVARHSDAHNSRHHWARMDSDAHLSEWLEFVGPLGLSSFG